MSGRFTHALFGRVVFEEGEEYLSFQYRFLIVVQLAAALATGLFLLGESTQLNRIDTPHVRSMAVFTALSLLLWLLLRGQRHRLRPIAFTYLAACELEYLSALLYVPQDEMRVLWFLTHIPGVYLLLGRRWGAGVTLGNLVGLLLLNPRLSAPYSANAMATLAVAMGYLALFFHVYVHRSISYVRQVQQLNQRLREMATHDTLTGLLEPRAYYDASERQLAAAGRSGRACAVLFVDLDHFKRINDTHGHAAGDEVLRQVARQLRETVRQGDLVGRIGGEEFSLFLPDTDEEQAAALAERLRARIEQLRIEAGGRPIPVTASIGVAACAGGSLAMAEIQKQADAAMYEAKARGRNRVSRLGNRIPPARPA